MSLGAAFSAESFGESIEIVLLAERIPNSLKTRHWNHCKTAIKRARARARRLSAVSFLGLADRFGIVSASGSRSARFATIDDNFHRFTTLNTGWIRGCLGGETFSSLESFESRNPGLRRPPINQI